MKNKTEKLAGSNCNDVCNGIERWIPVRGEKAPSGFPYESANKIRYRSERDAHICLSRAGVPEWETAK